MTNIDFINQALPETELLAQLAEECAELSQAALKLRRVLKRDEVSPTPEGVAACMTNLQEEIGDVLVCLQAAGYLADVTAQSEVEEVMRRKTRRWARRLGRKEEDAE